MINRLARTVTDAIKRALKKALFEVGLQHHRIPRVLRQRAETQLELTLPMLCAYHALAHKNCRYVHIGAFDGLTGDPLGSFARQLGWEGILIEPQPHRFEQLKANLSDVPGLRFENAAIAPQNGNATMYCIRRDLAEMGYPHASDRDFLDQCASLNYATISRCVSMFLPGVEPRVAISSFEVPTLTLEALLKKYQWDSVDLLQLDAEGLDYEIIKMINWDKSRPAIINSEHLPLSKSDHEDCARLLVDKGYRLYIYHVNTLAYLTEKSA
jgi:FkbM family methyltransferase